MREMESSEDFLPFSPLEGKEEVDQRRELVASSSSLADFFAVSSAALPGFRLEGLSLTGCLDFSRVDLLEESSWAVVLPERPRPREVLRDVSEEGSFRGAFLVLGGFSFCWDVPPLSSTDLR